MNGRPNDVRGFVHKSFIGRFVGGAVKGFIKSGPVGAITGGVRGAARGAASQTPGRCNPGFSMRNGLCQPDLGGGGVTDSLRGTTCPPGLVWDPALQVCVSPKSDFGTRALGDQGGQAVMGRFGAALVPANRVTNVAVCLRGMVLGVDGLCYNKRDISNKERMWPRGRRPLLTGGEMRAISTASRAATKVQSKVKQLQSLGLLKKPMARRKSKALGPGHTAAIVHET